MSRLSTHDVQPGIGVADNLESLLARIGAMNVAELRAFWRERFGTDAPAGISKDLIARALAYRLQERVYGGLKPQTVRLLRAQVTTPGAEPPRQVKVGSVVVREHKGVLHEVMLVPGGFCWRGETHGSLSTIARKITGVSWNGPRFFGLRSKKDVKKDAESAGSSGEDEADLGKLADPAGLPARSRRALQAGRRSSVRTGDGP
jgi:hypothetical protein